MSNGLTLSLHRAETGGALHEREDTEEDQGGINTGKLCWESAEQSWLADTTLL